MYFLLFCVLPDSQELCGVPWSRNGKLDLALLHDDLGIESTLMVHVGLHLNSRNNKFWHMDSHLSHELHSD